MAKTSVFSRARNLARFLSISPVTFWYVWKIKRSDLFDRNFYRGINPQMNALYRAFPERHYVLFGEAAGLQPCGSFSPKAYLRHNTDLNGLRRPFLHYLRYGRNELRITLDLPEGISSRGISPPALRPDDRTPAPYAIVVHIYYHEMWSEIAETLRAVALPFDLFVTLTWKGDETTTLVEEIKTAFPDARAIPMPNHGRDVFPFVHLVNSGLLTPYRAVCKLHTKKSPHRQDGDIWRRHLIDGILPREGLAEKLQAFIDDPKAAFWVADGQHYDSTEWWGINKASTAALLHRLEIRIDTDQLDFPAGSMYWIKPLMLRLIGGFQIGEADFEPEFTQLDGTLGHAYERAMGYLAKAAGQCVRETGELTPGRPAPRPRRAGYTSAFYLPQFHRTPENDAWWGQGYTEWMAAARARPVFPGHAQPVLPADLGFYDLRLTEVMGEQTELAKSAGIDAFCVYHYWFDGRRILEAPLDRLMDRPEIEFPFYLCWANESWRRNWDGLSGEILLNQSYAEGFEQALAEDTARYMRDPRYQRPDGSRPRFVIYRPEDMPAPAENVARLRDAWRALGVGEVELGAVRFHVEGEHPVEDDLFDFWIEMPPHGLVGMEDYLYGGREGNLLDFSVKGFRGLIYDYEKVIDNSLSPDYVAGLPANTIAGVMPSWDNTARRGAEAHIAYGAHPGAFHRWLGGLSEYRLEGSYRNELFVNAWNEWAEKATLEPSRQYGRAWLEVLGEWT
ncbi:lipopolysaccharide biosynthesis protein [Rhodovulum iodosum]|uniref:Lipopolysaccharide biosynthesis protein n=1 Tax=Rhodovulum iodosum TaxID=68291 RepID=A0ABV3XRU9_9RHOB|nr:glycoside hydrolase family 99-like domain-containing protein [Rhodovulum robiginosum]RSK30397.1 glycosyl transferase family 1 [Rhodovulum robiginosum]